MSLDAHFFHLLRFRLQCIFWCHFFLWHLQRFIEWLWAQTETKVRDQPFLFLFQFPCIFYCEMAHFFGIVSVQYVCVSVFGLCHVEFARTFYSFFEVKTIWQLGKFIVRYNHTRNFKSFVLLPLRMCTEKRRRTNNQKCNTSAATTTRATAEKEQIKLQ